MGVATIGDNSNIKGLLCGWGLSLSGRPCDSCQAASALVYCRADAAFLCGPCDATIHHHTPHDCVWVCEVCEQTPAVVVCEADTTALCSACDHGIHSVNPLARRHVRVPITPFADSITARSAATSSAFLVPDDLDTAVPTPPSLVNEDADTWLIPNPISNLLYNESELVSSSDIGVVPDNGNSNSMSEASYNFGRSTSVVEGGGITGMDREARVLRYREKRKNRKFQKTIRYASRKAYAETRPRIKGRFAKRTESNETSDLDFAVDSGYGVVPAF